VVSSELSRGDGFSLCRPSGNVRPPEFEIPSNPGHLPKHPVAAIRQTLTLKKRGIFPIFLFNFTPIKKTKIYFLTGV